MKLIILAVLLFIGISIPMASAEIAEIGTGFVPAIYQDNVVWCDNTGTVHYLNLTDGSDRIVAPTNGSYPHVYGTRVVWIDDSSEKLRLGIYNLSERRVSYVSGEFDELSRPRISGENIVWGAGGIVYLYDARSAETRELAKGYDPDVSGDRVVYIARVDRGTVIRVYNAKDDTTLTVPYTGDVYAPHIDGWQVIFAAAYDGSSDLYAYDLAREQLIQVARCDIVSVSPDRPEYEGLLDKSEIQGGKVVYVKPVSDGFGDAGIWVYDLSTGEKIMPVGLRSIVDLSVDISGNTIVWGYETPQGDGCACPIYAYMMGAE
jgi:hypothetical protein